MENDNTQVGALVRKCIAEADAAEMVKMTGALMAVILSENLGEDLTFAAKCAPKFAESLDGANLLKRSAEIAVGLDDEALGKAFRAHLEDAVSNHLNKPF